MPLPITVDSVKFSFCLQISEAKTKDNGHVREALWYSRKNRNQSQGCRCSHGYHSYQLCVFWVLFCFSKSLTFSGPPIHLPMKTCLHILHVLSQTEFYDSMVNTFKLLVCVLFEKKNSRYDTASLTLIKLFHCFLLSRER